MSGEPRPEVGAPYTLGRQLGSGGQGVVYEAFDARLERTVALKFLSPHLSHDDGAKQRFMIEARTVASLDHPNICTIHEIGETEGGAGKAAGRLFIVMPFYEGETVREKVARGPLPVGEACDIVIQAGRGLARAHARGIIHRDIKPANLLVTTDGVVKVVDFGIAKLADLTLTRTGTTLGTVAYMSPEQARGDRVDRRTDVWSLGAVLYEMLTGRRAFEGGHDQAVIYGILQSDPPPLEIPHSTKPLQSILDRALAKDPITRYPSVDSLIADLESARTGRGPDRSRGPTRRFSPALAAAFVALATVGAVLALGSWPDAESGQSSPEGTLSTTASLTGTEGIRRLVVLPFSNLRSDPESDYLGFAVADQVIGALANFHNVSVRPFSQVRQYAGQQVDPGGIGNELGADFVLTGGFLKVEDDIRLSIELLEVGSNALAWRQDIAVAFESAFALQDMVADSVIRGLEVRFSDAERARLDVDVPASPLAYEYFLRARAMPNATADNRLALDLVQQALALDSLFAPAQVELGQRLYWLAAHQLTNVDEYLNQSEAAFTRALALNPEQLGAIWFLVIIFQETGRGPQAYPLARRMLEINPNSPEAHGALSYLYRQAGLLDQAKAHAERAVALDPRSRDAGAMAGIASYYVGEYDLALRHFGPESRSPFLEWWKARVHFAAGRPDSTVRYLDRSLALDSEGFFPSSARTIKAVIAGDTAAAVEEYRSRQDSENTDGEVWYVDAQEGALLGEAELALRALRNAVRWGFFSYPLIRDDKALDPIRGSADFDAILQEARVRHEAFRRLVEEG